MPRILIDLRMVQGRLHGIARYALELARALPELEPTWELVGLTPPEGLPHGLGALAPCLPLVPARAAFLSPLEQPTLWRDIQKTRCDLFHATSFSLPALWSGKLVATLHDANHLALEHEYGLAQRLYYRAVVGPRAAAAQGLITVSEFSRAELARYLGISEYRFQVIRPGVSASFRPPTEAERAELRKRLGLPPAYFAVVANAKAFKNLGLLAKLASRVPIPLVLLAGEGVARQYGFPESTRELSGLDEEDIPRFLGAATGALVPSRYEGFGLPVLEAMACGTPVIAARAGALPEVAKDAAILLDPDDEPGWTEACTRLARDGAERASWSERGLARSALFRWADCAQQTAVVYRRALALA